MLCPEGFRCDPEVLACRANCALDGCPKGTQCDAAAGACVTQTDPCKPGSCIDGFACDPGDGQCKPACVALGCPPGSFCDEGTGRCFTTEGEFRVGQTCTQEVDCGPLLSCANELVSGLPGGYCTRACGSGNPCPAGSVCSYGLCLAKCSSSRSCREGYSCIPANAERLTGDYACFPFGSTCDVPPVSCARDEQCVPGRCVQGRCACSPEGGPCRSDDECARGAICLDEETFRIAGGFCLTVFCDRNPCAATESLCMEIARDLTACLPQCFLGDPQSCALGAACEPVAEPLGPPEMSCQGHEECAAVLPQAYCAAWGGDGAPLCTDPYAFPVCYPFSACRVDRDCGACASSADCRAGFSCAASSGTCEKLCALDAECGAGRGCVHGLCRWHCAETGGCRGLGGVCGADGHCAFVPQYCDPVLRRCTAACQADLDCDLVRSCEESGRCALSCAADRDCGPVGVCRGGVCLGACTFTGCAPGLYCDATGAGATQLCTSCTLDNEARLCGETRRCHADGRCGAPCTSDLSCGDLLCDSASGRCVACARSDQCGERYCSEGRCGPCTRENEAVVCARDGTTEPPACNLSTGRCRLAP